MRGGRFGAPFFSPLVFAGRTAAPLIIKFPKSGLGRDPAPGSSVIIIAITGGGGFFIFLGLATVFLA
jgi:Mg/Co/Ni transporter MgtE